MAYQTRQTLSPDSRTHQCTGPRPARHRSTDDRSSQPRGLRSRAELHRRACARSFRRKGDVLIFPGSGTGAWEAALVNTLSPGDRVLAYETGHFSTLWTKVARNLGLAVDYLPGDWRHGADAAAIGAKLAEDRDHEIKAVMVVHNETSTGVTSDVAAVRRRWTTRGIRRCSWWIPCRRSASMDYRHDEWRVDVTVAGSQKGLMLPPGLSFNAVSAKGDRGVEDRPGCRRITGVGTICSRAIPPASSRTLPRPTCFSACAKRCACSRKRAWRTFSARHLRLAEATRRAVDAWGLELLAVDPAEYSPPADGRPAAGALSTRPRSAR